jgi:hypothetical protein
MVSRPDELVFLDTGRRPPSVGPPYAWDGRVLAISQALLDVTFCVFESYRERSVEACCFWYGRHVSDTLSKACAVVVPRQINRRLNFDVPRSSILPVSEATRRKGWKNLAQLHSHPDTDVEHSSYDDLHANSRRALSIVLPNYGAPTVNWFGDVGLHEFQNDYWHYLSPHEASNRLRFDNSDEVELIDLR